MYARSWGHCRGKPGRAPQHVQACRGSLYRMNKHKIRRWRRAARLLTYQAMLDPFVRYSKVQTETFLKGKVMSDHGMFSSYKGQQGAANGQDS